MSSLSVTQWRVFLVTVIALLLATGWRMVYGGNPALHGSQATVILEQGCPPQPEEAARSDGGEEPGDKTPGGSGDLSGDFSEGPGETWAPSLSSVPLVPPPGRVDINRADAAELQTLPGIGPVLAARILAHRDQWGPFSHITDLLEVSGIGVRTLERLKDHIWIEEP